MSLERVMSTDSVFFITDHTADLGTFGEHVERSDPPRTDRQVDRELDEIATITERETDPVRALRRRFLSNAIDGLTAHMLQVRTMLSEADADDLPVQDADSIKEPMARLFYESSRMMERAARLATDREHWFPFLLSKLE